MSGLVRTRQSCLLGCHITAFLCPKADDVKALLRDATSPEVPESEVQSKILTKSAIASTGLTAAGASLLSTEYLKDIRAELADGSERPFRENSGM